MGASRADRFLDGFVHLLSWLLIGALLALLLVLPACKLSHQTDAEWIRTKDAIAQTTKATQDAAVMLGQGYAVPLVGAAGALATAIASLWHTDSGLPGTKRRKRKKAALSAAKEV